MRMFPTPASTGGRWFLTSRALETRPNLQPEWRASTLDLGGGGVRCSCDHTVARVKSIALSVIQIILEISLCAACRAKPRYRSRRVVMLTTYKKKI